MTHFIEVWPGMEPDNWGLETHSFVVSLKCPYIIFCQHWYQYTGLLLCPSNTTDVYKQALEIKKMESRDLQWCVAP